MKQKSNKMIKIGIIFLITASLITLSSVTWECNRCKQQYQGSNPPRFVKCPATNNKQTHWWIKK